MPLVKDDKSKPVKRIAKTKRLLQVIQAEFDEEDSRMCQKPLLRHQPQPLDRFSPMIVLTYEGTKKGRCFLLLQALYSPTIS